MKPKTPIQVIVLDGNGRELAVFYPEQLTTTKWIKTLNDAKNTNITIITPKWHKVNND